MADSESNSGPARAMGGRGGGRQQGRFGCAVNRSASPLVQRHQRHTKHTHPTPHRPAPACQVPLCSLTNTPCGMQKAVRSAAVRGGRAIPGPRTDYPGEPGTPDVKGPLLASPRATAPVADPAAIVAALRSPPASLAKGGAAAAASAAAATPAPTVDFSQLDTAALSATAAALVGDVEAAAGDAAEIEGWFAGMAALVAEHQAAAAAQHGGPQGSQFRGSVSVRACVCLLLHAHITASPPAACAALDPPGYDWEPPVPRPRIPLLRSCNASAGGGGGAACRLARA